MSRLFVALALASGVAQAQSVADDAVRSYVASAFITGAEPALLSEDLRVGPALRARLALPEQPGRDATYRALVDATLAQPIEVTGAPPALAGPGQAALSVRIGRELQLVVRYDLAAQEISYVGLPEESVPAPAVTVAAVAPAPRPSIAALPPVLFDFRSASLGEGAKPLADVSLLARLRGAARIRLTGHADSIGSEAYNLRLSQKRAEAVRDRLVTLGVDASRIEVIAAGSKPAPACAGVRPREAYIACLASERRVDILVER